MCNARPDYWLYFSSTFLPGTITGILIYQTKYKQLVFGYATIVSSPPLRVSNRWSVSISHPWGHQVRFLSGLYTPFGLVPARSYISTHEELYFAGRDSIIYQLYWVRLFRVTSVQLTTTQSSYCVYLTPLCYAMTIDFWTLKPEDLNTGTLLVMSFIAWSGWYPNHICFSTVPFNWSDISGYDIQSLFSLGTILPWYFHVPSTFVLFYFDSFRWRAGFTSETFVR